MDQNERKRRQVQRMAATAQPLQPAENHPGPGRGHTKKPHEKAKAGNRSDYLVARMARDRPDILERMKAGEFASVREAAREAGIIKEALVGFQGRGFVDSVQSDFCHSLLLESLIFQ